MNTMTAMQTVVQLVQWQMKSSHLDTIRSLIYINATTSTLHTYVLNTFAEAVDAVV